MLVKWALSSSFCVTYILLFGKGPQVYQPLPTLTDSIGSVSPNLVYIFIDLEEIGNPKLGALITLS